MKYPYGRNSRERLDTVHPEIKMLFIEAADYQDISILCGERKEAEQDQAVIDGNSFAHFPYSNHNVKLPERPKPIAIDAGPYIRELRNVPWTDGIKPGMTFEEIQAEVKLLVMWYEFAGLIKTIAAMRGVPLRWGGEFKSIFDPAHWELYGEKYNNL